VQVVRMLLDAGANLEAQDVLLNTALMACFSRFFVGFAWDVDFAGRNRQVGVDVGWGGGWMGLGVGVRVWVWVGVEVLVGQGWV